MFAVFWSDAAVTQCVDMLLHCLAALDLPGLQLWLGWLSQRWLFFVRVPRKPQHSAPSDSSRMPSGCQVLATNLSANLSANLSVALERGLITRSSVRLLVRLCCRYSCIIWIADGRGCKSVKDFASSVFMWTSFLQDDDKVHRNLARFYQSKNPAVKIVLRDRVFIQAKQPMGQIVSER